MTTENSTSAAPTVDEIIRITALTDPVNRNLQITACYWDLSSAFATRTGIMANWCTFATWASKQAGVTIRGEDMGRTIEAALKKEPEIQRILSLISLHAKKIGSEEVNDHIHESALAKLIKSASERASDAVARGNRKVYEEIGREFARFMATCTKDEVYKQSTIDDFCSKLTPGPPPEGQDFLCKAFTRYYQTYFETDPKKIAQLRFLANIEIGYHEQTRLQPEIAEALNAGLVNPQHVRDFVSDLQVNSKSIFGKIIYFIQWLIGNTDLFKKAIDSLVLAAEKHIRRVITKEMMTLTFPPDMIIYLGRDLAGTYPDLLKRLDNSDLLALLAQIDPSTDSPQGDGATDWSILNQRLHFIADLFRCYHESGNLFNAAFTSEQIEKIRAGGIPEGRL